MDHTQIVEWYGPWAGLRPPDVGDLLAGFDRPWWIAGGWAIEAFSGVARDHDDLDVGFFRSDLTELRRVLVPLHVWSVGSGMLRPLTDEVPDLHPESAQVWVRAGAAEPWIFDGLAADGDPTGWVHGHDPSIVLPLADATWMLGGIRYLNPELVLLFKAKHARPKDEVDLDAVLPRLSADRRHWLATSIDRLHPHHPWTSAIAP